MDQIRTKYASMSKERIADMLENSQIPDNEVSIAAQVLRKKKAEVTSDSSSSESDKSTSMSHYDQTTNRSEENYSGYAGSQEVIITDIKMPFISMVILMVKSAIAAIPALIILTIISGIIMSLLGGIFGGFGGF